MTIPYPLLAARLFDTPLMAHPAKARQVARVLMTRQRQRAGGDAVAVVETTTNAWGEVSMSVLTETGQVRGYDEPYRVFEGAAIMPIVGSLIHNSGLMDADSGNVGYDGIAARLRLAMEDRSVKGIWIPIDSYGGEVSGCFDCAAEFRASREAAGGKPIWFCVNESAYSAAYALASQGDVVVAPRSAGAGSIGVVMMHADYSEMLADEGVKVTLIHAGEHKVDGNPYQALSDDTYKDWLASCERIRGMFADTVAAGRGISAEAALATEARCYDAPDAKRLGLVDSIVSAKDGFAAFVEHLRGR
jgi:signal peptide peptidase SppA